VSPPDLRIVFGLHRQLETNALQSLTIEILDGNAAQLRQQPFTQLTAV
jgi:hypothetical protein